MAGNKMLARGLPSSSFYWYLLFAVITGAVGSVRGVLTLSAGPLAFQPLPALYFLAGFFGGPIGILGVLSGHVTSAIVSQSGVSLLLIAYLYLGSTAYLMRSYLLSAGEGDRHGRLAVLYRSLVLAGLTTLGAAPLTAWVYELVGRYHFFPFAVLTALTLFTSILFFAIPVVLVGHYIRTRTPTADETTSPSGLLFGVKGYHDGTPLPTLVSFPTFWLIVGSVLSIGLHIGKQIPPVFFRLRGIEFLYTLRGLDGSGAGVSTVQIGLGAFVIALWVGSLRHSRHETETDDY